MRSRTDWKCRGCVKVPDPYIEVIVDGLLFQANREYDPYQIGYLMNGWWGWREGPEVKSGETQWEDADGGYIDDPLFGGRDLEFSGIMRGRDEAHLHQMMEALGAVLTTGDRVGSLVVREQLLKLERRVSVRRGGRPVMKQVSETLATWSAQFTSSEWRRVHVTESNVTLSTSGSNVQNIGNAEAVTILDMRGPLNAGVGIDWPGGSWRYSLPIASGKRVLVYMDERLVAEAGSSDRSRGAVGGSGNWLYLPPGTTKVTRVGGGSGNMLLRWRHSWS